MASKAWQLPEQHKVVGLALALCWCCLPAAIQPAPLDLLQHGM